MARVPYVDPEDVPPENRPLLDTLAEEADTPAAEYGLEGGTLNVYRALGNDLGLLEAFRTYGSTLWREGGLDPHERETVILATARAADSPYEWHQHVRVALNEGMSQGTILAISRREYDELEPTLAAIAAYVDRFVHAEVDDEHHDRLAARVDRETLLGVGMLAGCYLGLSRSLDALDVETEIEFVGWELENL